MGAYVAALLLCLLTCVAHAQNVLTPVAPQVAVPAQAYMM
jgi:hypothetical protein